MTRLRFPMDQAFRPDDPVAVFVMTLSMAFGDLRILAEYVPRDAQPDHERIYFVRLMASHLREIVKVIDLDADKPNIGGLRGLTPGGGPGRPRTDPAEAPRPGP